jgi:hypothetical protein
MMLSKKTWSLLIIFLGFISVGSWLWYQNTDVGKAKRLKQERVQLKIKVLDAITNIRVVRSKIKLHTKSKPSDVQNHAFLQDAERRMDVARVELLGNVESVRNLFSIDIANRVEQFARWDGSFSTYEVCTWNAPSDKEYREIQEDINLIMQKFIEQSES